MERWRRRRGRRWTAKDGLTFLRHLRGPLSHHVLGKRNRPKTRGLFGISSSVIISFDEGERGLRAGALDPRPWILDVMGCRMHPRVSSFFFCSVRDGGSFTIRGPGLSQRAETDWPVVTKAVPRSCRFSSLPPYGAAAVWCWVGLGWIRLGWCLSGVANRKPTPWLARANQVYLLME